VLPTAKGFFQFFVWLHSSEAAATSIVDGTEKLRAGFVS